MIGTSGLGGACIFSMTCCGSVSGTCKTLVGCRDCDQPLHKHACLGYRTALSQKSPVLRSFSRTHAKFLTYTQQHTRDACKTNKTEHSEKAMAVRSDLEYNRLCTVNRVDAFHHFLDQLPDVSICCVENNVDLLGCGHRITCLGYRCKRSCCARRKGRICCNLRLLRLSCCC